MSGKQGQESGQKLVECKPAKERLDLPEDPRERVMMLLPAAAIVAVVAIILVIAHFAFFSGTRESRCESAALGEWKNSCWNALAHDSGNADYCDRISDGALKDDCITDLGMGSGSITLATCNKLGTMALKESCFQKLAADRGDPSGCRFINDSVYASQCFSAAASASGNPLLCAQLYDEASRQDCSNRVYTEIAVERRDPRICNNLTYSEGSALQLLIDQCVVTVASSANDTAMCEMVYDDSLRATCQGASSLGNCGEIADDNTRNVCWYTSAVLDSKAEYCARITGVGTRDSCYYQVAARTFNATLCGAISGENTKAACVSAVGMR